MKYFLIILVFVSGMSSLALEMCASRLLGAYFGTSLYIWASLIGLILVYLTVGYFIGGRLADRYPSEQVLCTITGLAALSISILPFVSQSILPKKFVRVDDQAGRCMLFLPLVVS